MADWPEVEATFSGPSSSSANQDWSDSVLLGLFRLPTLGGGVSRNGLGVGEEVEATPSRPLSLVSVIKFWSDSGFLGLFRLLSSGCSVSGNDAGTQETVRFRSSQVFCQESSRVSVVSFPESSLPGSVVLLH